MARKHVRDRTARPLRAAERPRPDADPSPALRATEAARLLSELTDAQACIERALSIRGVPGTSVMGRLGFVRDYLIRIIADVE